MTKGTIRLSLLVILTLALLPPLVARATGAQVVQVTSDADRDAETSIAINPTEQRPRGLDLVGRPHVWIRSFL